MVRSELSAGLGKAIHSLRSWLEHLLLGPAQGTPYRTSPSLQRGHRGAESRPHAPAPPTSHIQDRVCCSGRQDLGAALVESTR